MFFKRFLTGVEIAALEGRFAANLGDLLGVNPS